MKGYTGSIAPAATSSADPTNFHPTEFLTTILLSQSRHSVTCHLYVRSSLLSSRRVGRCTDNGWIDSTAQIYRTNSSDDSSSSSTDSSPSSPTDSSYSFSPAPPYTSSTKSAPTIEEEIEANEQPSSLPTISIPSAFSRRVNTLPAKKKAPTSGGTKSLLAKLAKERMDNQKWEKYDGFTFEVELNLSQEELRR